MRPNFDPASDEFTDEPADLTNVMDLAMVLMILFMIIAAVTGASVVQTSVSLADGAGNATATSDVVPFVIEIDKAGEINIQQGPVDVEELRGVLQQLKQTNPQPPVHVACDREANFQSLAQVLTLASSEGLTTNLITHQENSQ